MSFRKSNIHQTGTRSQIEFQKRNFLLNVIGLKLKLKSKLLAIVAADLK
jgi:hypothetical protein